MNRRIVAVAAGMGVLAFLSTAYAQPPSGTDKKEDRVLFAGGVGTVRVAPDAVRLTFGVLTGAASAKETRTENDKNAKRVLDALNELKIAGLEIRSSAGEMRIVKQFNGGFNPGGGVGGDLMPTISGYRVTTSYAVLYKDKNPDKLREVANKVLDAVLDAGVNADAQGTTNDNWRFGGGMAFDGNMIEMIRLDMPELQRQALGKAVEDALVNAKALANGAKVTIADTVGIGEANTGMDGANPLGGSLYGGGGRFRSGPTSITNFSTRVTIEGELEITCRVNVRCRY